MRNLRMSLLPVLAGLLLVLPGHELNEFAVHGAPSGAARSDDIYGELDLESLIDRLYTRLNRQLQVEQLRAKKRRLETIDILPEEKEIIKEDIPPPLNPRYGTEEINLKILDKSIENDNDLDTIVDPVGSDDSGGSATDGGKLPPEKGEAPVPPKTQPVDAAPIPQAQTQNEQKGGGVTGIEKDSFLFIFIVTACSIAGLIGVIMAGVCWYKLHRHVKAASDVDYPAYGVTGPTKERLPSPGDRKLAQSAQMYHYQHQKQQMIALEKANGETKHDASEDESEEENEEGDYTVYECPGLAPTGEMEVRNPLFTEAPNTPVNGEPVAPSQDSDRK